VCYAIIITKKEEVLKQFLIKTSPKCALCKLIYFQRTIESGHMETFVAA
jgi:hypothetical protein